MTPVGCQPPAGCTAHLHPAPSAHCPTCPAATSGCTADLAAGVGQAVASQLAASADNVTTTCAPASDRRRRLAATSIALRVSVAYPSAQAAQQAQQVVLSSISSGTFIASLTASLPTAGRELPGLSRHLDLTRYLVYRPRPTQLGKACGSPVLRAWDPTWGCT